MTSSRPHLALIAVTGTLALAACTSSTATIPAAPAPSSTAATSATTPQAPPPVPRPDPATVNRTDPTAVSQAALELMYLVDTTSDTGWADAAHRALPLLSSRYAQGVRAGGGRTPAGTWQEWTQHRAYTTVELKPSAETHPIDTTTQAHRPWLLTITPTGRDGWRGEPEQRAAFVTLTHADNGWAVDHITTQ
ncbi:hypothetical protein GCM10012275_60800 [Longimycelium tulufanense]|uniref:Uncharacterized protein n=1 Tax=Longimycelium tulufanense TaxID=907463 RepID=A0A8J3CED1_9PSEU|nr:hypothetical protein [Longimycelium tulufanense]GGM82011.1 hypothetical protein GCM10012275_60800 [Longimycelium tulufanense]